MSEVKLPDHRQAQHVAGFGLLLQVACFGTLTGLAVWSESPSIGALARLAAVGLPIWFVLFLVFKQLRRVAAEQVETTELKRAQAAGPTETIFDLDDEALLIERNRLRWILKWILPSVTALLFVYLLVGYFLVGTAAGWAWAFQLAFAWGEFPQTQAPMMMMWFIVGIGFFSFLYARYSIALARQPQWRLLRAGASVMAGTAMACLLLAIALMAGTAFAWTEALFVYLLRVVLLMLGVEFAANFVLDFYRPRTPGVLPRPSFESRLLGLVAEPGAIAKSIADAINYQFGFEVSSTWFYQLLQRWLFPIMVFTCVVVVSLSSIVIVDADEQAVIERFGRIAGGDAPVLEPGLHFKWPYPVDVVRRAPVRRIRELVIGESTLTEDHDSEKAVLWSEAHDYVPELMLLVNAPRRPGEDGGPGQASRRSRDSKSVPVALLMVSAPLEYRIKDIRKYLYAYQNPEQLLEAVAYQFLTDYGAGVDLDTLIGPARDQLNRQLQARLQSKLGEYDAGVEVVFAGTRGAHPPAKDGVAEAFLGVITAEMQKAATINAVEGEAQKILTAVAGTEARALALDEAIVKRDRLQADPAADPAERAAADRCVDDLLLGDPAKGIPALSGQAAALIAEARASASNTISDAAAKVRAFKTDLAAYNSAPELFQQRKWMEVWDDRDGVRKYLITGDPTKVIIEYETEEKVGLDTVLSDQKK